MVNWRAFVSSLIFLYVCVPFVIAQSVEHCFPGIEPDDPNGYQMLGSKDSHNDRCEGFFVQKLSSPLFDIVSFTHFFERFDVETEKPLKLSWIAPSNDVTYIQSKGIKYRLYYRMDTERAGGESSFYWPIDVLRARIKIQYNDIGLLAWNEVEDNGETQNLYLPLVLTQQADEAPTTSYLARLLSRQKLREVYYEVENSAGSVISMHPLEYGYYPENRPIPINIPIDSLNQTGIYRLLLTGEKPDGTRLKSKDFWFYHVASED